MSANTKDRLLDAAQILVQTRGYNAFSFHDLATVVGITTASIHYHFPTKSKLGAELVRRYTDNFMTALGDPLATPAESQLRRYASLFRRVVTKGRMCLCGMMGSESDGIPAEVAAEVRKFFLANERWLVRVIEATGERSAAARSKARFFVASMEGAMLLARASGSTASFDDVARIALPVAVSKSDRPKSPQRRNALLVP